LVDGVMVDVQEVHDWALRARDSRAGVEDLRVPAGVLRGDLLPGWYDDWVLLERERLRQLRMHTLDALAEKLGRAGRHGEAVEVAHAAVRADPLRESAHRVLVRLHLAEGNIAEALRTYESYRAVVLEELGMQPSARMEALVSGLRRPHPVRVLVAAPQRRFPAVDVGRTAWRR
jgi:two-component SAPR family response regulator